MSKLNCHMQHKDEHMVAAFSNCMDGHIMGFIVTENDTFEVTPLTHELETIARSSIESNKLWRSGDTSGNEITVYIYFIPFLCLFMAIIFCSDKSSRSGNVTCFYSALNLFLSDMAF